MMSVLRYRWLAVCVCLLALPPVALAQTAVQLKSTAVGGTIAANGESVTLNNTGGLASVTVQTLDSYTGTLQLQCATDAAQTAFDATNGLVMLTLMGSSTTSTSITDTVGVYQGNISGCTAVKLIATAGFAASDTTVRIVAITPGGGSSGGGASGAVSITQGGNTAAVNASSQLSVTCANCSGSGVSVLEDAASANGDAGTPAYAVRKATPANTSGTDGDYEALQISAGRLWASATIDAALPAGNNNIGDVDIASGTLTTVSTVTNLSQFGAAAINLGAGTTGTGTLRVTLPTDGTGVLGSIGSITAAVTPGTAAANLGKAEDAVHASSDTGVMALGVRTDTAAAIAGTTGDYAPFIIDALGKIWTTGSYAEDAAHVDGETGVLGLAVRRDADTSLVGTDGDRAPLQVNAAGSLKVAITAGAGSGGTSLADNAGFTPATTSFTPIGGEVDDTGTTAATENSAAAARMTVQRALHVNLRTAAGVELTPSTDQTLDAALTTTGPLMVGRGSTATPTAMSADNDATAFWVDLNGRLHTATEGIEDVAETAAAPLAMVGTVRRDTAASSAGTTGDNATLNTDATGNLWVTGTAIEDAAETAGGTLSMAGAVRRDVLASSSGTSGDNSTLNTTSTGALWVAQPDPCSWGTKVFVNISQTTGTQLFTGTASNRTYVCAIHLVSATAQNIALVSGTGTVCATGIAGMAGGTTAATGWNLAANGGLVIAGGNSSVAKSGANADNVCILQSGSGQISGNIVYVVAP